MLKLDGVGDRCATTDWGGEQKHVLDVNDGMGGTEGMNRGGGAGNTNLSWSLQRRRY